MITQNDTVARKEKKRINSSFEKLLHLGEIDEKGPERTLKSGWWYQFKSRNIWFHGSQKMNNYLDISKKVNEMWKILLEFFNIEHIGGLDIIEADLLE